MCMCTHTHIRTTERKRSYGLELVILIEDFLEKAILGLRNSNYILHQTTREEILKLSKILESLGLMVGWVLVLLLIFPTSGNGKET